MAMLGSSFASAQDYQGPRPPKTDVPYLVHANNLVPTDVGEATEESRKDMSVFALPGAAATARTPLAEPVFLIATKQLVADRLGLYQFFVEKGRREVRLPKQAGKRSKDASRNFRVTATRVADGLYRLEAAEPLENGEYSLSPEGSNQVFSFQVY